MVVVAGVTTKAKGGNDVWRAPKLTFSASKSRFYLDLRLLISELIKL